MLPKEQGGEGLTATQAALKYMASSMTGTEIGRLAAMPADFKPGNTFAIPNSNEGLVQAGPNRWEKYATIPQTITNAPAALPQKDAEGNVIGNIIQLPGEKPLYRANTSTGSDLASLVKKRQQAAGGGKSTAVDSQPLPEKKEELKKGTLYQTARGPAVWDGEKFVKQ